MDSAIRSVLDTFDEAGDVSPSADRLDTFHDDLDQDASDMDPRFDGYADLDDDEEEDEDYGSSPADRFDAPVDHHDDDFDMDDMDDMDDAPLRETEEAIAAAIRAEMSERAEPAPKAARPHAPVVPAGVPVVEDFDPEEDSIVIGYCRDEVGDGRIGITEDPKSPGTARVTLGGRVVAIVPGGYGYVAAHHIELELVERAA